MTLQHFNIHTWGRAGVFTLFFLATQISSSKFYPTPKMLLIKALRGVSLSSFIEFPKFGIILDTRTAGPHFYDFYHIYDNMFHEF